jgi:hypothetical protein
MEFLNRAIEFQIGGQNFVTSPLFECGASFFASNCCIAKAASKSALLALPTTFNLPTTTTPQTAWFFAASWISQCDSNGAQISMNREVLLNLPRARIKMSDADIVSRFERLGYKLAIDQIAFTTESVEDFHDARETQWTGVGTIKIYEEGGLLLIEKAQPRAGQPTRDIAIISLGHARAVMGVLKPDKSAELPRYAARM